MPTILIDCGSPTDSGFTGGLAFTIPALPQGTDATMRYGPSFSYRIAADGPQMLTLRFVEPSYSIAGQRRFCVLVNDQQVVTDIDLVAEAGVWLVPVVRSVLVFPADGFLTISFKTSIAGRNCLVSSIELTPLEEVLSPE